MPLGALWGAVQRPIYAVFGGSFCEKRRASPGPRSRVAAMSVYPALRPRTKPTVLLILQGPHHLMLYRDLFARCEAFHWVCVLEDVGKVSRDLVTRLYQLHGVQILTDERAALLNFPAIDAVVTTCAVPHATHGAFIRYLALAYEMGLPVFELQHGLFQLGINYSERAALVGTGLAGALTALDAPNLTRSKLVWSETDAGDATCIGYPLFGPHVRDCPSALRPQDGVVLVATNLHWNIFSAQDVTQCWDHLVSLFRRLPDLRFVLMPHPGEMKSAALRRGLERCAREGIVNVEARRPADRAEFVAMVAEARMAVSMVSTLLLDFEMYDLPCVMLPCPRTERLTAGLEQVCAPATFEAFATAVEAAYYGRDDAMLRTGRLVPFAPEALVDAVQGAMGGTRAPIEQAVPMIARYIERAS